MSHFTTVETQIRDEAVLRHLIKELGYNIVEDIELKGYAGSIFAVDFQIEVKNGYNIGFKKINNNIQLVGDKFMNPQYQPIVTNILQGYATNIVMRNVNAMGYTQVKRTVDKDNTIKLTLVKR